MSYLPAYKLVAATLTCACVACPARVQRHWEVCAQTEMSVEMLRVLAAKVHAQEEVIFQLRPDRRSVGHEAAILAVL